MILGAPFVDFWGGGVEQSRVAIRLSFVKRNKTPSASALKKKMPMTGKEVSV